MAYDPNLNNPDPNLNRPDANLNRPDPTLNRPDLNAPPPRAARTSWTPWVAIAAVVVAGVAIWSMVSGPTTDPTTTSSTTPPATSDTNSTAPATRPLEPTAPAGDAAPVAPGTSQP